MKAYSHGRKSAPKGRTSARQPISHDRRPDDPRPSHIDMRPRQKQSPRRISALFVAAAAAVCVFTALKFNEQRNRPSVNPPANTQTTTNVPEADSGRFNFHPAFKARLNRVLAEMKRKGFHYVILSGIRTEADQERIRREYKALHAKGIHTHPVAKFSAHTLRAAADIVGVDAKGERLTGQAKAVFYDTLHAVAEEHELAPELIKTVSHKDKKGKVKTTTVHNDRPHVQLSWPEINKLGLRDEYHSEATRELDALFKKETQSASRYPQP